MSTALATRPDQTAAEWSFADLMSLGKELVPTGFLPEHVKTPAQAAAIILTGRELGMPPMRALRSLFMVKGKVTESADSQLARFKLDGGRATFQKLTDTEAVLVLRHPNGDEHTETFTMEDAKRAAAGEMYRKFPKAMLRSRVITAGLKSIGWNGATGIYDPSELETAPRLLAAVEPITASATVVREEPEPAIPADLAEGSWPAGEIRGATSMEQLEEIRQRMKASGVTTGDVVTLWKARARELGQ